MFELDVVSLSRLQFAFTALYHFIFVPLTLGLAFILAITESVYVMTNRPIWRDITMFWGKLFGVNFALGVATGIVMEFQFGMNWSTYSAFVGDVFGAPLALEGLMAFFLEASFVGLFFFGWDRLSKVGHLIVTWLVAFGTNFSALWILVANGWMQNPAGAHFNPHTGRMEMESFFQIFFNPVAQAKFVHTVSAGYVTAAMLIMSIGAWYVLKGKHIGLAKRSMVVAASFGLLSALSVVILGDESGYLQTEHQKMKIAAIEAMWETEPAPASFNIIAIPDEKNRENSFSVHIPYVMGIIGTRSLNTPILGINDLVHEAENHVKDGLIAYQILTKVRQNTATAEELALFKQYSNLYGYALLLKRYRDDIENATPAQIEKAALDTVPSVTLLFFAFRAMVASGIYLIAFFAIAFWLASKRKLTSSPRFLKIAMCSFPIPWIATTSGWIVAEIGRQPWVIEGILPTFYAVSHLNVSDVLVTLSLFILVYSILFVLGTKVMIKTIVSGPSMSDSKPL